VIRKDEQERRTESSEDREKEVRKANGNFPSILRGPVTSETKCWADLKEDWL
jgi:hypothetical protein